MAVLLLTACEAPKELGEMCIRDSLDLGHNLAQRNRTSDTCHILDADFVGTCLDKLQCHLRVVFSGMDG